MVESVQEHEMTYYKDLERCDYFDQHIDASINLTAVGWLEAAHPYRQGHAPADFVDRLIELLERVWDPIRFRGKHSCSLCHPDRWVRRNYAGRIVDIGATNLFVPKCGDDGLFVAPSLILHYVVDHDYNPPSEFQVAVMECPDTVSSAYFHRMGGIIPTTPEWRDGLFGYWNSMGAAIATEAGLMSRSEWSACFENFSKGRSSFSASDLAAEAPEWFSARHIEPLTALEESLERQGKLDDAQAIREWGNSVEFLGRHAPRNKEIEFANGRYLEPPPQRIPSHHSRFVTAIAVSGRDRAVSGSADSQLLVWDLGSQRPTRLLEEHTESIHGLTALDEDRFISASSDETLRIWNVEAGEVVQVLREHGAPVQAVAVVDHQWLVAGVGSALWVRDLDSFEVTQVLEGQTGRVSAITDLGQSRLLAASSDGTMLVWDLFSGEQIQAWDGHSANVQAVAKLADLSVVSASNDGTLGVWDPTSGRLLRKLEGHTDQVRDVVSIPGHRVASVSWDRSVRIWSVASGETEAVFPMDMGGNALALTGDELQLMVGDLTGRVLFFPLDNRRQPTN